MAVPMVHADNPPILEEHGDLPKEPYREMIFA